MTEDQQLTRVRAALLPRYLIERELGRGGMAHVYLGTDTKHNRQVAIKVMSPRLAEVGVARFLKEIKITARLRHHNILTLLDSGEVIGLPYYVMPYIEGETLKGQIHRERQMEISTALRLAREIADALDAAHDLGIIHRDIKPANVLLEHGRAIVADFGIARAVDEMGATGITATGLGVGTPGYMSPEQATGEKHIDKRSDVYSLGCVVYEMLAGEKPYTGNTAQSIFNKQISLPPPRLRVIRSTVTQQVDDAIQRCLQKVPADRYPTAGAFASALERPLSAGVDPGPRTGNLRRIAVVVASVATVAAAGWLVANRGEPVDRALYMLAPLGPATSGEESYPVLRYYLQASLEAVPNARAVETARVDDGLARLERGNPTLEDLRAVAQSLGAGSLIVPEVTVLPDSLGIVLSGFDPRTGQPLPDWTPVAATVSGVQPAWETLSADLVERAVHLEPGSLAAFSSSNDETVAAYARGRSALEREWDLDQADSLLNLALEFDQGFAPAHLQLAEVEYWRDPRSDDWASHARAASSRRQDLIGPYDSTFADALVAVADGEFDRACVLYGSVLGVDSSSFRAWYGMGECNARDPFVLTDPASPSGLAFRGSYQQASEAYRRAFRLIPSFQLAFRDQAYQRLSDLLYTRPYAIRGGRLLESDPGNRVRVGAFVSWSGDSLAFVPAPLAEVLAGQPAPTSAQAIEHNLAVLHEIVAEWVTRFRNTMSAQETYGLVLEAAGQVQQPNSALEAFEHALRLARQPSDSLRISASIVRIHVKRQNTELAASIADRALAGVPDDSLSASIAAGLAALLGKAHLTADLLARGAAHYREAQRNPTWRSMLLPLVVDRERRRAFAAIGAPKDSLTRASEIMSATLQTFGAGADSLRQAEYQLLMDDIEAWAFPMVGPGPAHRPRAPNQLLGLQWRLMQGERDSLKARLDALSSRRRSDRPGELSVNRAFHEAWLYLQIPDTASAARLLDRTLGALEMQSLDLVREPQQAASLARAAALLARLQAANRSELESNPWYHFARSLWGNADAEAKSALSEILGTSELW